MGAEPGHGVNVAVLFPIPGGGPYTYSAPADWECRVLPGARVIAPLGRKLLTGLVLETGCPVPPGVKQLRPLRELVDSRPLLGTDLLDLIRWLSSYYFCELGEALRSVVPAAFLRVGERVVSPAGDFPETLPELSPTQRRLLDLVRARGRTAVGKLRRELGGHSFLSALDALENLGLVKIDDLLPRLPGPRTSSVVRLAAPLPPREILDALLGRSRRQRELFDYLGSLAHPVELRFLSGKMGFAPAVVKGLLDKGLALSERVGESRDPFSTVELPVYEHPVPSPSQEKVIAAVHGAPDRHRVYLLHGVTGSGKTLVYLELLRPVLEQGRQAIVLVPEIALTPQTLARFRGIFGDRVAVLHSGLSDGERYDIWNEIRRGRYQVAVGPRSAVFAPFPDLGIVVLDEEHESTYKQTDYTPRYHARDVAIRRMLTAGGPVVLGSATPSLESWFEARMGEHVLLELPARVAGVLPEVRISDLRRGWNAGDRSGVTPLLVREIGHALTAGGQVLVLLNRRGFSNFMLCGECGQIVGCGNCRISLTLHKRINRLLCHYCGHQETIPSACPSCGSASVSLEGAGTERVESLLREAFPERVIDRMDVDTTGGKWSHHEILERLRTGATDILVGTQMIAKGLDFPNVLLVGVVSADTAMNLPDFRATERTFQLLAQVAGRTGRGERSGEVLIQTFNPAHPAIRAAVGHDYAGFARLELEVRREASYPPFVRLLNVVFSGADEPTVELFAAETADLVRALIRKKDLGGRLSLLGPAPCALEKLRGRHRRHLILKCPDPALLGSVGTFLAGRIKPPAKGACRVTLDRDPVSLM